MLWISNLVRSPSVNRVTRLSEYVSRVTIHVMKNGLSISGLFLLILLMAGCDSGNATLIPQTAVDDVVTITVVATEAAVFATNDITPSPAVEIRVTPLVTPNLSRSTPACVGAENTRMIVGERGRVTDNDERPLNVRSGPGTEFRIIGRLEVLEVFDVLDGPQCGTDYIWYRIHRADGLEGWVAEGVPGQDFIEPYLSG